MTTKKRREWSDEARMAVYAEMPPRRIADRLLDARADLAEVQRDLSMYTKLMYEYRDELRQIREVCFMDSLPEARARLEGAIEALTWVADHPDFILRGDCADFYDTLNLRIAELRVELDAIKPLK